MKESYMAESKGFEPLRQGYPPTRFPIVLLRPLGQLSIFMAPQVGFEPTTARLTAECSTTELLRNYDMGLNGLEPSTSRLSGVRSNQLSYRPIIISVGAGEGNRTLIISLEG